MKVVIGPYKNWFGPYQIAELLCFWAKPVKDEFGHPTKPDWVYDFGTWLAENKDGTETKLYKLCHWINEKRKRQVYVRIDRYDTWNMDDTLAQIILPMLKQLKQTKHGSPHVDDFDCPQHLWSTNALPKEHDWDIDSNWHKRWEYVINEMIWCFEQHQLDDEDEKFWTQPQDPKLELKERLDKATLDEQNYRLHHHRKQRAFELFGKYYKNLWD
jgi:hypothetical protein